MPRAQALLIDRRSGAPLSPDWSPWLENTELEAANHRLAADPTCLNYTWQWATIAPTP
jgi:hypothetical protein